MLQEEFRIEFYRNSNGRSEVADFFETLREKPTKKNQLILAQFERCIEFINENGLRHVKGLIHSIRDGVWEFILKDQRIFFLTYKHGKLILLSICKKDSQRARKREIDKAISRKKLWLKENKNRR